LTNGGCCGQPFWSPDGQRLLFIDRPSLADPSGIWGIGLQGGAPELISTRVGIFSSDLELLATLEGGQTIVERLSDGQRWTIPNGGRAVSFSPDGAQVAWTIDQIGGPLEAARREIWTSRVDGSEPRLAVALFGGGLAGWFPDGRLLVSGRLNLEETLTGYYAWSAIDERLVEIAQGARLRGAVLSPGGTWLAYMVTFHQEPAENGLWLAHTQTGERRRLDMFGAYRWRDDGRLLVIPLDLSAPYHQLWQVEAASGRAQPLTDPAVTPFKIANGDWTVAPGGRQIAFLAAEDNNIWLLELPPE
jgi:Tol biopolymer transport system component